MSTFSVEQVGGITGVAPEGEARPAAPRPDVFQNIDARSQQEIPDAIANTIIIHASRQIDIIDGSDMVSLVYSDGTLKALIPGPKSDAWLMRVYDSLNRRIPVEFYDRRQRDIVIVLLDGAPPYITRLQSARR